MRAIVLHNPSAGTGHLAADDLLAALAAGGIEARYRSTEQRGFRDALAQPADLVLVDGGAGTVVKVIGHLRDRGLPIALVPLGGANNIARSLASRPIRSRSPGRAGARSIPVRSTSAPPPARGASNCSSRRSASARSPRRRPRSLSGTCLIARSPGRRGKPLLEVLAAAGGQEVETALALSLGE